MAGQKTVGIKDLKNNLSAYLREVRRGTRVLVSDRLAAWVRAGIVTLPTSKKTPMEKSPVKLPDGTAARLLNEDRRDRGR
jgi:antitoxin (DNA-binding transcriptional repressor) of toxin-antitoxin stability system